MATFGGTVRFSYGGKPLVLRAHITTGPSSVKAEPVPNQDGSISRTLTPWGHRATLKFEDSTPGSGGAVSSPIPQPWDAIIRGGPYNFSCAELLTGVTHTWANALFFGEPKVNRESGEVDGLEIICSEGNYNILTGA